MLGLFGGIKVDHAWGEQTAGTLDFIPSVGVMGDHKNIYYGVDYIVICWMRSKK